MKTKFIRILFTGIMAYGVVSMTGCAFNIPGTQTDSVAEEDEKKDAEEDNENDDDDKKSSRDDKEDNVDEAEGLGTLKPEVLDYFGFTYTEHLNNGGKEAELLHADRYIAGCPELDADAVFLGEWDGDQSGNEDMPVLRLEGSVEAFFTGTVETMSADDFIKALEENFSVDSEYMESAGTAYYVSGDDYLHIELVSDDAPDRTIVLEIACRKDEKIKPSTYCWILEKRLSAPSFGDIPSDFVFSSGAGGWGTEISISADGSFEGVFHDSDMGDTGTGYSNGTVYICNFSGHFSELEATDDPFICSLKLNDITVLDDKAAGTEEIIDEVRYVYSTPYGFDNADEFFLYLPGASLSDMSEACRSWVYISESIFSTLPDGYYVLYNIGGEEAFTAQSDNNIWWRTCRYECGDAYVRFTPSYSGSYLSFFVNDDSPSEILLDVPWDGKSTEPMECGRSWNDDGSVFSVTVEKADGWSPDFLSYDVAVACISDPDFDFSTWGSAEPGKFEAVFTEIEE